MQDDKVVEGKVRLARILGERMEKAFYPAARRSFSIRRQRQMCIRYRLRGVLSRRRRMWGRLFMPGRRRMSSLLLRIVMC